MPKENVIEINQDVKCVQCGKPGATQSGLCLWCVGEKIMVSPFLKGLHKIPSVISDLIQEYQKEIEEAWSNIGDSEFLSISFSAKMGLTQGKGVSEIGIRFSKEKVKGSKRVEWDPKQMSLIK